MGASIWRPLIAAAPARFSLRAFYQTRCWKRVERRATNGYPIYRLSDWRLTYLRKIGYFSTKLACDARRTHHFLMF
jgi:hypothetical protein